MPFRYMNRKLKHYRLMQPLLQNHREKNSCYKIKDLLLNQDKCLIKDNEEVVKKLNLAATDLHQM